MKPAPKPNIISKFLSKPGISNGLGLCVTLHNTHFWFYAISIFLQNTIFHHCVVYNVM